MAAAAALGGRLLLRALPAAGRLLTARRLLAAAFRTLFARLLLTAAFRALRLLTALRSRGRLRLAAALALAAPFGACGGLRLSALAAAALLAL